MTEPGDRWELRTHSMRVFPPGHGEHNPARLAHPVSPGKAEIFPSKLDGSSSQLQPVELYLQVCCPPAFNPEVEISITAQSLIPTKKVGARPPLQFDQKMSENLSLEAFQGKLPTLKLAQAQAVKNLPTLAGLRHPLSFMALFFGLGLGSFDFFNLMQAEIVGVHTTGIATEAGVVHFVKADNHWILDATLVHGSYSANFLIPVRLWTEDFYLRTTLNHRFYSLITNRRTVFRLLCPQADPIFEFLKFYCHLPRKRYLLLH